MAISTNSPEKTTSEQQNSTQQPAPDNPNPPNSDLPNSSAAPPSATPANATVVTVNPNPSSQPTPSQSTDIAPPPQIQSFVPPSQVSTLHTSYRPAALPVPLPTAPQFSPIPNPNFQNYGVQGQGQVQVQVQVQPPGVMMQPHSQATGGAMSSIPQMMPPPQYGQPGQQPMRMYAPMPNGYQMAVPQGTMNPPELASN